jgi:aspartate aminotransferase
VLINSPNNPSGVVYGKETIEKLCALLKKKSEDYKKPIFLISDEPYRELIYDKDTSVPCVMNYYDNSIVCYSYSKSLSLPGERIGYIALSPKAENNRKIYASICGAGRMLGYVCAPALFQRVVAECDGMTGELETYRKNRDLLYNGLTESGYNCIYPDGAFYLFVEALEKDTKAFCERAKKYELLLVAGDDFGCPGWVRIAYCVKTDTIARALPLFKKLAEEYRK